MSKVIDLNNYAPIISNTAIAKEIYQQILAANPKENQIEIDMTKILSMTTFVAKFIFGQLYFNLGQDIFSKNIKLKSTDPVCSIIQSGISDYVNSASMGVEA